MKAVIMSLSAGLALCLAGTSARAAEEPPTGTAAAQVNMAQVLDLASQGPDALAALGQADKQDAVASAHWRAAYMPKLVAGGGYLHADREVDIPLYPLGGLPLLLQDTWAVGAMAELPILDLEGMLYGVRTYDRAAQAAALAARQAGRDSQLKALQYYLQALELRARRRALQEFADNLSARGNEIQRIYDLGGVGEADLMKVKLGVDDARQGVQELAEKEALLAGMLAQSLNRDAPAWPEDLPAGLPQASPGEGDPAGRFDLKALGLQMEATESDQAASESGFIPKVNAVAGYLRTDTKQIDQQEVYTLGATVSWTVFDGAVRQAKAKAAQGELESLRQKRRSALLALKAQLDDAAAMLRIKHQEYEQRLKAVDEAQKAADLEFKRLRQGKVSVNNFIDAEEVLRDRKEKAALSRIAWWQEWFQCQASGGLELSLPQASAQMEVRP
jgi:outer membrane protein TolC